MKLYQVLLVMAILAWKRGLAGCYFPLEFQGEFLSQSMISREIAYNSISILFDSIPSWGTCHRRLGRHVILASEKTESSSSSEAANTAPASQDNQCFKCISIVSRSANVLQIHTNGLQERCHPTEELARQSCPTQQNIRERKAQEMMFYKTRSFYGGSAITRTYCPLNGRFRFTYSINDGMETDLECHEPVSEASDCPSGYKFDLHFRGCSFPNFDMSFQCLGSWPGENGETYMSLLDTKLPQLGEEPRPRYRCALFKEDPETGLTHMALSSDSTCVNHLYSSQDGYETLHMEKIEQPQQPQDIMVSSARCEFPKWMKGDWEGLHIGDNGEFSFRDEENFVTYRGHCVTQMPNAEENLDGLEGQRYLLFLSTDCGTTSYSCALFQRRDTNVLEFQLGISSSDSFSGSESLCTAENFTPSKWITLGRTDLEDPTHCPLVGEYSGILPDADGLCARSYADCNNPEVMFYTVFNCANASEVYEEREYRCFGQWKDSEGLVYTYTERRDIPGKECFVGITMDGDERHMVTEAGANCERGHQPQKYGMTLRRQSKCPSSVISSQSNIPSVSEPASSKRIPITPPPSLRPPNSRPVSPRLSTVRSVVVDGVEQLMEKIEEEAEQRYYDRETTSKFGNNNGRHRHHNKHGHNLHGQHGNRDQDIHTNEIPDDETNSRSHTSKGSGPRIQGSATMILVMTTLSLMMVSTSAMRS